MKDYLKRWNISDVKIVYTKYKKSTAGLEYPNVLISDSTQSEIPLQSKLDAGWEGAGYDYYAGLYRYTKKEDIRKIMRVEIEYTKETQIGGSTRQLVERHQYPIPKDVLEDIALSEYEGKPLPEHMKGRVLSLLGTDLYK